MFLARLKKWSFCTICNAEFSCSRTRKHDQDEFEDTKVVIRIRKSKATQHNGQKKKDKRTNNDLQNIHIKLKIQ